MYNGHLVHLALEHNSWNFGVNVDETHLLLGTSFWSSAEDNGLRPTGDSSLRLLDSTSGKLRTYAEQIENVSRIYDVSSEKLHLSNIDYDVSTLLRTRSG